MCFDFTFSLFTIHVSRFTVSLVMDGLHQIGRLLIIIGIVCAAMGGLILFSGRLPWLGRLPGDIIIQKKNFTFYFPLMTSILVSIIFTLLLWFFGRR